MMNWIFAIWPVDENGDPEEDVLLGNENDLISERGTCTALLEICGIPYFACPPEAVDGETPSGANIYVPVSMLEQARDMINGAEDIICAEDKEDLLK